MRLSAGRWWFAILAIVLAAVGVDTLSVAPTVAQSAFVIIGGTPPTTGPAPGERYTNLSEGLFVYSHPDLYLAGPLPIRMQRTYRTQDINGSGQFNVRTFGLGWTLNYNTFLYSQSEAANPSNPSYTDAELVLPDGGQLYCARTSTCSQQGCTDYTDAVFQYTANPDRIFFGAKITWNASTPGWDLTRKDGTVYSFGQGAPLQSVHDRHGNQVTLVRSGGQSGDITQISDSNGRYINLTYGDSANPHQVTQAADNSGRSVSYVYDTSHRLTSVTDPNGETTTISYGTGSQLGDITSATDPLGNVGNISYGTSNRVSGLSAALGSYSFAYTVSSGVITACSITDPNGFVRRLTYNSAGYVLTDTRDSGTGHLNALTTYTRDSSTDHILSVVDPLNRETDYVYDSLGNVTTVTKRAVTPNSVWSFTYNSFAEITSITDPLNHIWTYGYDSSGNLTSAEDATLLTWSATYNSSGEPVSFTDPLSETTHYGYASNGDLSSVTDPNNNVYQVSADTIGRLASITDPLRNTSSFTYDADSRLTQHRRQRPQHFVHIRRDRRSDQSYRS